MTLSSMVVSRDWQEISVLECILGSLHMDVAVESEPQRAMARITKSKIDALIVDCDLNGTGQFFRQLQQEGPRANTVPLVIMGCKQGRPEMQATGATATLATVETTLCDFHSLVKGRYYPGLDIDVMLEQLLGAGLSEEMLGVALRARRLSLPGEYLGELEGFRWRGPDRARKQVYRRTGEIVERG